MFHILFGKPLTGDLPQLKKEANDRVKAVEQEKLIDQKKEKDSILSDSDPEIDDIDIPNKI